MAKCWSGGFAPKSKSFQKNRESSSSAATFQFARTEKVALTPQATLMHSNFLFSCIHPRVQLHALLRVIPGEPACARVCVRVCARVRWPPGHICAGHVCCVFVSVCVRVHVSSPRVQCVAQLCVCGERVVCVSLHECVREKVCASLCVVRCANLATQQSQ